MYIYTDIYIYIHIYIYIYNVYYDRQVILINGDILCGLYFHNYPFKVPAKLTVFLAGVPAGGAYWVVQIGPKTFDGPLCSPCYEYAVVR